MLVFLAAERAEVRCNLADDPTCAETDATRANADALQQLSRWWQARELAAAMGGEPH